MLKYVLLLLSALISSEASGSLRFDDAFSISYAVEGELLRLNFTWDGDHDWAALGLHNKTNEGMPNAEILMCNTKTCQVRYSMDYVKPDLSKNQYLDDVSIEKLKSGQNFASFTRSLKQPSALSVAITNQTLGLIFARGVMDSTTGEPYVMKNVSFFLLFHTIKTHIQVNSRYDTRSMASEFLSQRCSTITKSSSNAWSFSDTISYSQSRSLARSFRCPHDDRTVSASRGSAHDQARIQTSI